ncbi:MAG: metal ABC transporter permease [Clostridiales bacterium GWB2_37_7]|nr:MAG: metal ABC transporter permease [Clostridiales bacterium GWB2_37_7]
MEMLQYDFMQRAFLAGILISIICPIIGTFVVLRRLSMIGDTLSHASLAGIAAGMLGNFYPMWGAIIFSVAAAIGIEKLRKNFSQYAELSISIVLSASIGLAVLMISLADSFNADLMSFLFGSIIAVTAKDIMIMAGISLFIIISVWLLYKELLYITFDEEGAALAGIPTETLNIFFTVLTALTIVAAMRVVGILMISSMLVVPVAASMQISKSFRSTMLNSVIFGLIAVVLGLIASYYFNLAPGGTIVLFSVALLLLMIGSKKFILKSGS